MFNVLLEHSFKEVRYSSLKIWETIVTEAIITEASFLSGFSFMKINNSQGMTGKERLSL